MKINKKILVRPLLLLILVSILNGCKDDPVDLPEEDESVKMPTAAFNVSSTEAGTDVAIQFTNASKNAFYYVWNFADGTVLTDESPSHSFASDGVYRVSLAAVGDGGVVDTAYKTITIIEGNVSIFEGEGITGVSLYETTWGDLLINYGIDTANYLGYTDTYKYYYFVVTYEDLGMTFYLYSNGESKLYPSAEVFVVCVWGLEYQGGTTEEGIGITSTLTDLVDAYGDAEDLITGIWNNQSYTYYSYPSLGIDFLDFDEDKIYEIDIYGASDDKSTSSGLSRKAVQDIVKEYRSTHSVIQ